MPPRSPPPRTRSPGRLVPVTWPDIKRIGELARRSGLSASAVRYYEQLGLLPASRRNASGYRCYADNTVDRLAFVRSAQAVGLTLAEVGQVLGGRDAGEPPCRVVTELIDPPTPAIAEAPSSRVRSGC